MTLVAGARLGPYEILAPLGAGGMGEVYRARDSRLGRDVAIKVLPAAVADDADRVARLRREAHLLAALQHANIAAIYGLEEADGTLALALELVEGEDLAQRLLRGAIPVEEALDITRQIAEALEDAHERGIVHRDLKPANVKLTPEGKVKVLDFGLAKAWSGPSGTSGPGSDVSHSPTLAYTGTGAGMIVGTAAYMSPEQAAGRPVDRRADIWSFGVVLYEMLSGRRLFVGETASEILASVIKDAPDLTRLPPSTPPRIVDLVQRCLRKKPRERLQSMGEARLVLEEALAGPAAGLPAAAPPSPRASRLAWAVAVVGLVGMAGFAALWLAGRTRATPGRVVQASLVAPPGMAIGDTFALSPDGRRLVMEVWDTKDASRALWLRDLERGSLEKLPETTGGEMPFWSPDGDQVGFFAGGKLRRLDVRGGPAQDICDAPTARGGTWGPDGRIVFSPSFRTGLSIVPAAGGEAKVLTTLDTARGEKSHRFPVFLPDGKAIVFLAQTAEGGARNDASGIEVLDLGSGARTRLMGGNSSPLLSHAGHLLFWRDGTLFAQPFDARRRALSGDARALAAPVSYTQNEQVLASVADEGTLVYREGRRGALSRMVWLDRKGVGVDVIRETGMNPDFVLSRDGQRLAVAAHAIGQGSADIWIHDVKAGSSSRLTFEGGSESYPVWSADDRYLYYASDSRNDGVILRRRADGTGTPEEIGTTDQGIWPQAASRDGKWLVIVAVSAGTSQDLLRFDLATKEIAPLVQTPSLDQDAALSPDDRLLAYASEDSGRWEVYVQAVGGQKGRWQVSGDRGRRPRWRADGRELYYLSPPDRLMVVDVTPGDVPRFSAPRVLFTFPADTFDVSPDGQRFVVATFAEGEADKPLTLVTNWIGRLAAAPR